MTFLPGILLAMLLLSLYGPFPQPLSYHDFADNRVLLGMPHVGDVLTNLGFLAVGAWGFWLLAQPDRLQETFIDPRERSLFRWFFIAIILTAFGSAWYHLQPGNDSLVWDRLAMVLGFVSIFTIVIGERVSPSVGYVLFGPLITLGLASVLYWSWTESRGTGDLRWYLLVQFYVLLTIALALTLLRSPYTLGSHYWVLFLCYLAALAAEFHDHEIFRLTAQTVSGHNLKHLLAAAGIAWLLRMLRLRRPLSAGKNASSISG